MRLLPSVLNWSYHRAYWGKWNESLDSYLERVAKLAGKYGFERMGINIGTGGEQNQLADCSRGYVLEVKAKLDELGFHPIPIVGNLEIHADPSFVDGSLEKLRAGLERSLWLGADVSTFNIGLHGRLTREKAVQIYTDGVRRMADIAAEYGQLICSENYNTFTSVEIATVVEKSGRDNVGYLNDVGNWLIVGEDPYSVAKKLASRTIHVHLKDYLLDDGIWRSVPLGRGIVPLDDILAHLSESDEDRDVYMALETDIDGGDEDEALEGCFQFMRSWYDRQNKGS